MFCDSPLRKVRDVLRSGYHPHWMIRKFFWGMIFVILQGVLGKIGVVTWFLDGEFVVGLW
jgi:hypothetical protein